MCSCCFCTNSLETSFLTLFLPATFWIHEVLLDDRCCLTAFMRSWCQFNSVPAFLQASREHSWVLVVSETTVLFDSLHEVLQHSGSTWVTATWLCHQLCCVTNFSNSVPSCNWRTFLIVSWVLVVCCFCINSVVWHCSSPEFGRGCLRLSPWQWVHSH